MKSASLRAIVGALCGKRVLTIGDVMLDEYIWGRVSRISPEAPVPVVAVERVSYMAGGAANAANNVIGLGGDALLCGVIGDDDSGRKVAGILAAERLVLDGLVVDSQRPTTLKTRIVAQNQYVVRADRETRQPIGQITQDALWRFISRMLPVADVCLISDYGKGVITGSLCQETITLARQLEKPVVVDPKGTDYAKYKGATVLTPNKAEAALAVNAEINTEEDILRVGRLLLDKIECQAVAITRGEEGVSLIERNGFTISIPALSRPVHEVTGAGDTVVATLSLALAAGNSLVVAAYLGNCAAGVVVGKMGTERVSPAELLSALEEASSTLFLNTSDELALLQAAIGTTLL